MSASSEFLFRSRKPSALLTAMIEQFWYAAGKIDYDHDVIIPNNQAVIIFNLGDPHLSRHIADPLAETAVLRNAWLVGPQSYPRINSPMGKTHVAGISFSTLGVPAFTSIPVNELSNLVIPLDQLWNCRDVERYLDQLLNAKGVEEVFGVLQSICEERWVEPPRAFGKMPTILTMLLCGDYSVEFIAKHTGISHKHLINEFRRFAGLSPYLLLRIHRFNALLNSINPHRHVDWAKLAYEWGWSDQSHLIKDFKRFSGVSPSRYMQRRREIFGERELETGKDTIFIPAR